MIIAAARRITRFTPMWALAALVALAITAVLDPGEALARVGGGDSYGGGGGRSSGGGGGGDGAIIWLLFELMRFLLILTIEHPAIGIPLDIIFVIVVIVVLRRRARMQGGGGARPGTAGGRVSHGAARSPAIRRSAAIAAALGRLRDEDANFSRPLLLDFVQLLYTRSHELRGSGRLGELAPYLSTRVRQQLAALPGQGRLAGVEHVVIGASRVIEVGGWNGQHRSLVVEFEANYTEQRGEGATVSGQTLYTHERWTFRRREGVLSKGPEAMTELRCPSCGAAAELAPDGTCPYCRNVVDRGDFHWTVIGVQVLQRRPRERHELHSGGGAEVGTDLPSVIQPDLGGALRALQMRDPSFDLGGVKRLVGDVFVELQRAWTQMTWDKARALETDHLYTTHRFWMDRFKAAGQRNVLDAIEVRRIELVKVEQDAFYDALTVRIRASMIDYTVDGDGKVLAGSKNRPRVFSEYWTMIRRAGHTPDEPQSAASCPSCGAPVKVDQAGVCAHCGTKVVTGEFGWVLSSIEQDEVYGG